MTRMDGEIMVWITNLVSVIRWRNECRVVKDGQTHLGHSAIYERMLET